MDTRVAYSRAKKSAWKGKLRRETLGAAAAAATLVEGGEDDDGNIEGRRGFEGKRACRRRGSG